jgi:hypothetical protein
VNKLRWQEDTAPVWQDETTTRVEILLNKKYQSFLNGEAFDVEAEKNDEVVQVRTTLSSLDGKVIYPIEAVLVRSGQPEFEVENLAILLLDYLDTYWNEYITGGRDTFLPLDWSKYECEGEEFFLRGSVRDLSAESAADALFREHGTGEHHIEGISQET